MAKVLSKISSGLIEDEDFSGGILSPWILSPEDASVEYSNGLILKSSDSGVELIREVPEKECVIDIYNTFNPTGLNKAIISIFENEDITLDVEEYFEDGKLFSYPYIRIVRCHNRYSFYASNDFKDWEFLGMESILIRTPKMKIRLEPGDLDYILNRVRIYDRADIEIRGLSQGFKVSILESGTINILGKGVVREHKNNCSIPISKIEKNTPIQMKIEDENGFEIFLSGEMKVSGGEIYQYDYVLDIEDEDGNVLIPLIANGLGGLKEEHTYKRFTATNNSGNSISECIMKISEKDDNTFQRVKISERIDGVYDYELNIGNFSNLESKDFFLRVERDMFGIISEIKFDLKIETI